MNCPLCCLITPTLILLGEVSVLLSGRPLALKVPPAEVAFECEQGSISMPSICSTVNGQNARPRPNQRFGVASTFPWEYINLQSQSTLC